MSVMTTIYLYIITFSFYLIMQFIVANMGNNRCIDKIINECQTRKIRGDRDVKKNGVKILYLVHFLHYNIRNNFYCT